jgi:tRNA 2-selenouridine synthase
MTWRELSVEQFNKLKSALIIDVRSPCEHAAESIPDAVNVPLLSDDERVEIGTIYNQEGDLVARRRALQFISPKIPSFVESVAERKQHGQPIVVHCWRGGLRSEAVASVLSIAGIDCFRLTGGYKSWRGQVVSDLANNAYQFDPIVLVGLTGSGKTEILSALQELGMQVLDLEALANHRGSVFGGLGLGEQPTQKNFDAALWMKLRTLQPGKLFLEGESRRIGRISLPDCVYHRILKATPVLVTGSVEKRAARITADYLNPAFNPQQELSRALLLLQNLKDRLGAKVVAELEALLTAGEILPAVQRILVEYYDPLYNKGIERCRPFALEVNGDDVQQAAKDISKWATAAVK